MPELDTYDAADIDNEFVDNTSWSQRREAIVAAEEELNRRDAERAKNRAQRLKDAAADLEDENELRREQLRLNGVVDDEESDARASDVEDDNILNIEAFDVPLREWISQERTRREIKRRFKDFLFNFYIKDNLEDSTLKTMKRKKKDLIYFNKIQ